MTSTTANRRSRARASGRRTGRGPSRVAIRRRRAVLFAVVLLVGGGIALAISMGTVQEGIRHLTLPLQHEDIIRQQARDKNLDPALIAAVIYQESKFSDRTSPAGAKGLMQITPETAQFIARKSGGTAFELRDLSTPQVNISYGSWYLRYLIERYDGNQTLAIAAYNAGATNVDKWVARAGGDSRFDPGADIPFPETRHYVSSVRKHRRDYRENYAKELGLD